MNRVLVVEDDPFARRLFAAVLGRYGFECDVVPDGAQAIGRLCVEQYCAIVLDLLLPTVSGFAVLQFVRETRADLLECVVVVTAADRATLRDYDFSGTAAVMRKPVDIEEFAKAVRTCGAQKSEA